MDAVTYLRDPSGFASLKAPVFSKFPLLCYLDEVIICTRSAVRGRRKPVRATGSVAECGRAPITDRAQGMEVSSASSRRADPGLAAAWWTVLLLRGILPAAFRGRDGCARRRRATRRSSRRSASRFAGTIFRAASGAQFRFIRPLSANPRRPHCRMALRPAHRGLRAPRRAWGTSRMRSSPADPHRRARTSTLGNDRPAAGDLYGFHRQRHGRDDWRGGVRCNPRQIRVVGRPIVLAGRVVGNALASSARAPSGTTRNTDEVRAAQRDADYSYRLAVDPPASKELRLFGLADWTIDRFHRPGRTRFATKLPVRRHTICASVR